MAHDSAAFPGPVPAVNDAPTTAMTGSPFEARSSRSSQAASAFSFAASCVRPRVPSVRAGGAGPPPVAVAGAPAAAGATGAAGAASDQISSARQQAIAVTPTAAIQPALRNRTFQSRRPAKPRATTPALTSG
jgi:hypothetical protein